MEKFKKVVILFFVLTWFCAISVAIQAQDVIKVGGKNYLMHKVENSETLFSISKKFEVDQKDIINANPELSHGLKSGFTIRIPLKQAIVPVPKGGATASVSEFFIHTVKKGETAFSISKMYAISVQDLYKINPGVENELQEKDLLRIPNSSKNVESSLVAIDEPKEDAKYYYHRVVAGENPSALSRRYNIRITDLFAANPDLKENFPAGTLIRIPKKNESTETKSDSYFWHEIESGDTFFSYQRKFGVSKQELVDLNPDLSSDLPVGVKIKIPTSHLTQTQKSDNQLIKYNEHVVQKGETIYGLATKFGLKVDDLKDINPELKTRDLNLGETILLPKNIAYSAPSTQSQTSVRVGNTVADAANPFDDKKGVNARKLSKIPTDTFEIALFLPLYVDKNFSQVKDTSNAKDDEDESSPSTSDSNGTDSGSVNRSLYRSSRNFVSFYEGFLLGLDSMRHQGAKIKLRVYDTQSGSGFFDKAQKNGALNQVDLIVGPADVVHQKNVAQFAQKNHIPMVSPVSASDSLTVKYSYYFQTTSTKKYIAKKTADYIADNHYDQNVVMIRLGGTPDAIEAQVVSTIHDKMKSVASKNNIKSVDYQEVDFGGSTANIRNVLTKDKVNVVYIPAPSNRNVREVALSKVVNALQVLAVDYKIVLVGYSDYLRFKSINADYFHHLNLTYLTSSFVDYNDNKVKKFVLNYRDEFIAEPNQFSFRGYDVAVYFTKAYLNFGKGYYNALDEFSTSLLQVDFDFKKVGDNGGFTNQGVQVVRLSSNYKVDVIAKFNNGKFNKLK